LGTTVLDKKLLQADYIQVMPGTFLATAFCLLVCWPKT